MDSIRSVIETLKWLPLPDILRCSQVSSFFLKVSHTPEIWLDLCEQHQITLTANSQSIEQFFRANYIRSNFVFLLFPTYQHVFNCGVNQWTKKRAGKVPGAFWNAAYVVLEVDLLICGGGSPSSNQACRYSPFAQQVTTLKPMKDIRAGHGLAYFQGVVYAFGGYSSPQSSEKFQDETWSLMHQMRCNHSWFTTAVLKALIYLCGGMTNVCEVFNPHSETFSTLMFQLPEASEACACVYRNRLVIMQRTYTTEMGSRSVLRSGQIALGGMWANMQPVVIGDTAYLPRQDNDCVRRLWLGDLETIEVMPWMPKQN